MYAATAKGTIGERRRAQPHITASKPNVATNSLKAWAGPDRAWREAKNSGNSNITWAAATPAKAPSTWAPRYGGTARPAMPPRGASATGPAGVEGGAGAGPA